MHKPPKLSNAEIREHNAWTFTVVGPCSRTPPRTPESRSEALCASQQNSDLLAELQDEDDFNKRFNNEENYPPDEFFEYEVEEIFWEELRREE